METVKCSGQKWRLTVIFPVRNVRDSGKRSNLGNVEPKTQIQEPAAYYFLRYIFHGFEDFSIVGIIHYGDHQSRSHVQRYTYTPKITLRRYTCDCRNRRQNVVYLKIRNIYNYMAHFIFQLSCLHKTSIFRIFVQLRDMWAFMEQKIDLDISFHNVFLSV